MLVSQNDLSLTLDERDVLLLLRANPREFELLDVRKVSEDDAWAQLAVSGEDVIVRELNAVSVFRWRAGGD